MSKTREQIRAAIKVVRTLDGFVDALMQLPGLRLQERAEEYDAATHELAVIDRSQTFMLGGKALVALADDEHGWPEREYPKVELATASGVAVTLLVLLPHGCYERSLVMRMPPHSGLVLAFGGWELEVDRVEYDPESDSYLVMDDPTLYGPDEAGEAEWLRTQLVKHGFTYREDPYYDDGRTHCRICGCTEDHACIDPESRQPCHWVEPDLCSACAERQNAEYLERERNAQEIRAHEMGRDA